MSITKLSEEARKQRAEYYRKYRAEHKEEIRESNRKYWEKRAAKARGEDVKSKDSE